MRRDSKVQELRRWQKDWRIINGRSDIDADVGVRVVGRMMEEGEGEGRQQQEKDLNSER